jgi:hypothetical protein
MNRIRIGVLCLAAAFAFSAVAATSALATPAEEILFKFTNGNIEQGGTFSGESTTPSAKLRTLAGTEVKCTTVLVRGEFLNAHLGLTLILFHKCTTTGNVACTTAGQPSGLIHVPLALFHLGLAHLGNVLNIPAIIILLPASGVSFECTGGIKIKVTGNVIGELQKSNGQRPGLNEPLSTINLVFKQVSTGMQELTLILLPLGGGTLTNQHLTTEINPGAVIEESSQESSTPLTNYKNSTGAATEIELVAG